MAVTQITASSMLPLKGEKRWAYLARAKTIRFASTNEDGSIYLSPLWFVVQDQKIYIPVDAGSRHGKNWEAGRPMSALIDSGDEYATVAGVRILGKVSQVDDEQLVDELQKLVFEKYFHVGHPFAENYSEFGEFAGRRYYEVVPDKMIGWDMRENTSLAVPEARVLPAHIGDRPLPGA
jgi:general stress protein 26